MNKGIILRASLILGTFLIIILVAVGCEMFDGKAQEAQISNPDNVYMTIDGLEVTDGELWDVMKNVDGLDYLFDYVDEYLLADYIEAVTQEEIDAEIRLLTYLTKDEEIIANIMEDPEIHQDYLDAFRQNVEVLGYDSDDAESLKSFVELSIAKRNYTKERVMNETDTESSLYVLPSAFEDYYNANNKGDVCSLDIRFQNTLEMDEVFKHFNYVINYDNGIGLYTDTETPIEEVAKADFDETNTTKMDEAQVWAAYVKIYNFMNPWATQLDENITKEDFCANNADIAVKNFNDLTKFKADQDPNVMLAKYLFDDIDLTDEGTIPYTFTTNKVFGDFIMLSYKLSQETVTAYADLSAEAKALNDTDFYENIITDTEIGIATRLLREENGFEILDPQFQLKYEFETSISFDNDGSETLVAKLDDMDISVDDFFAYMKDRIGVFYSLEVAKIKVLINSDSYVDIYGDSRDYINNKSDKMIDHRDSLREMKATFSSNGYASYGFSSSEMSWEEFIFLAFGVESEADLIKAMFVVNELQFDFKFDTIMYESGVDYMQDKIDRYFSVGVNHLLIYVDYDNDFTPDDFSEFVDGLTEAEKTEYNALKLAFENTILAKIASDMSLEDIVDEYTATLMSDTESDWYEFKNYGFFIMTENLGEIDHLTVESLDDSFGDSLKRLYDSYQLQKTESSLMDDRVTVSDFGIHFIEALKGANFDKKTAEFAFDSETEGKYSPDSVNDSELPSKAQVELWLQLKEAEAKGEVSEIQLPASVKSAIDYYYGPIYDAYMSQTGFSIAMGNHLLANNISYTDNNVENVAHLQNLISVFEEVNFPELFDKDAQ